MTQREPVERVDAWKCIGCGRIETYRPCIGVCQDRKAVFVDAADYDRLETEAAALRAIVRQIATITPREGEWKSSYIALQARARAALRGLGDPCDR